MNNRVNELFDQMSKEEFKDLLEGVGFEVADGEGEIIYTDNFKEISWEDSNNISFSLNTKNNYKVNQKTTYKTSYPTAC